MAFSPYSPMHIPEKQPTTCQECGKSGPTQHIFFMQNIGALIMRWEKTVENDLCLHCTKKHFWKMTAINFFISVQQEI